MYLVAVITNNGTPLSKTFNTRDEVEEWLLSLVDNEGWKYYRIKNKVTGKLVETEKKVYIKKGEIKCI